MQLCRRFGLWGLLLVLAGGFNFSSATADPSAADPARREPAAGPVCAGRLVGARWCDPGDGTIKDLATGRVWIRKVDCWDRMRWYEGLTKPYKRLRHGVCGLADGSRWGDWRMPTREELVALTSGPEAIRYRRPGPFSGLQSDYYWTTTTKADSRDYAWALNMLSGATVSSPKSMYYYLIPVRNN